MKTSSSLPVDAIAASQAVAADSPIRSYAELQQRMREDLRAQHPEWVAPDGNCPMCDSYERRLAELLGLFQSAQRDLAAA